jgi:uncharacterized protein
MKLLAFTDVHGNESLIRGITKLARAKKPDFLVCCGDLTIFGEEINDILSKFDRIGIPMILIPGNHEEIIDLKKICKKFKNVIYLHRGILEIEDYVFFGYGGDGFSKEDKDFEKIFKKVGDRIKGKKIIFLTHQPPFGGKLDKLEYFGHVGNTSYTKFIKFYKPILALSGHLHENFGRMDHVNKKTILINPGPVGKIIKV